MLLGELLVAQGLVSTSDVDQALEHQKENGGRLGECLVALDLIADETLGETLRATPMAAGSIADTGLGRDLLRDLLLKSLSKELIANPSVLAGGLKLSPAIVAEMIDDARQCGLVETCNGAAAGNTAGADAYLRLTAKGNDWAAAAFRRCAYVGPAPVPLQRYTQQVRDQAIAGERLDMAAVDAGLAGYVCDLALRRLLGPAVNSGRAILLYGADGNGKTLLAQHLARLFTRIVHIPYCLEANGQIIRLFDPDVHRPVETVQDEGDSLPSASGTDTRWIACHRPVVATGADLTTDALELTYDAGLGAYDAPVQLKACNGVLMLDDLGRQRDDTNALVNRCLAPVAAGSERLPLPSGGGVDMPRDGLLVLITGFPPAEVIEPDLMRRIPYKIEVRGPSRAAFSELLRAEASARRIDLSDADATFVMDMIEDGYGEPLAYYQPSFLIRRLVAACDFQATAPAFTRDLAEDAISHLFVTRA